MPHALGHEHLSSPYTYKAAQFTFDEHRRQFTAEMSDLGLRPGEIPGNLTITSHDAEADTTAAMSFRFVGGINDERGDVQYVMYRSSTGVTVRLIND